MAASASLNVLVERRDHVARLVINRPPLNILDIPTLGEMRAALDAALGDSDVRLVEFTGAGEKAFSVGTDIRDHVPGRAPDMLREFHALIRAVLALRWPSVAIVRGHSLGGGMELALACDFILAAQSARFAQPEINVGAFPPVAAVLLPRIIPEKKALELILTGEPISADEAFRLGLVNRVASDDALDDEARKFSDILLAKSSDILTLARRTTRLGSLQAFESALRETERIYLEELLPTEDAKEGIQAFLDKRPARWRN